MCSRSRLPSSQKERAFYAQHTLLNTKMALRRAFTQAIRQTTASTTSSSASSASSLYASRFLFSGNGNNNNNNNTNKRAISSSSRSNYAEEPTQTSLQKFQELFDKYRPSMMDPPGTPTTYMPASDLPKGGEEEVKNAGPPPEHVKLNFRLPHEAVFADADVNMVLVPAETGDFGILPGHVPVVAKLRPGVVSVENKESVTSKVSPLLHHLLHRRPYFFLLLLLCFFFLSSSSAPLGCFCVTRGKKEREYQHRCKLSMF